MRKLLYLIPALCLAFASCDLAEDKLKHYAEADEVFPVKIKTYQEGDFEVNGIDKKGDMVLTPQIATYVPGETYVLEPVFEEGFAPTPGSKFKYTWYMMYEAAIGVRVRVDLVVDSDTPTFEAAFPANLDPSKNYTVYFEALDTEKELRANGYMIPNFHKTEVDWRGIFILKDVGGKTDIDHYFTRSLTNITTTWTLPTNQQLQDTLHANVLGDPKGLGEPLDGSPLAFLSLEDRYWWYDPVQGTNVNKGGAWQIATTADMYTTTRAFNEVLVHFEDNFFPFYTPERNNVQGFNSRKDMWGGGFFRNAMYMWMLNDGQIWGARIQMGLNAVMRFNTWATPDDGFPAFNTSHWLGSSSGCLFWDTSRGQLCYMNGSFATTVYAPTAYATAEGDDLLGGKKVDLLAMLPGGGDVRSMTANCADVNSHMILRNKENGNHYLMKWISGGSGVGDKWIRDIPAGADITATPQPKMASSFYNEVVYYVKGNQIWAYEDRAQPLGTTLQLSDYQRDTGMRIGEGETVVQFKTLFFEYSAFLDRSYFALSVLTSKPGGGYKYYIFKANGLIDEFNPTPMYVLEGEGTPVDDFARFEYMIGW